MADLKRALPPGQSPAPGVNYTKFTCPFAGETWHGLSLFWQAARTINLSNVVRCRREPSSSILIVQSELLIRLEAGQRAL